MLNVPTIISEDNVKKHFTKCPENIVNKTFLVLNKIIHKCYSLYKSVYFFSIIIKDCFKDISDNLCFTQMNKEDKIITNLGMKFRIKKYARKLSVIIPTMQKNINILQKLLDNLQIDNAVEEIIIIDNSNNGFSQEFLSKYSKIKLIINTENKFVNPSWNKGIKIAKNNYWALFNDDVISPPNFCSDVLEKLNPNMGIVGIDEESVHNLTEDSIENVCHSEKKLIIEPTDIRNYDFGIIMFGHKKSYYKIPNKIKVWFGDDYLFVKNQNKKKQNYIIKNTKIYHCHSLTSNMTCFDKIKKEDEKIFFYALYKPFEKIFSMKNYNKIHKIITILGIKIKIERRKYRRKTSEK